MTFSPMKLSTTTLYIIGLIAIFNFECLMQSVTFFILVLCVVMMNAVNHLNVVMTSVVVPGVVMLSVVILSVMVPSKVFFAKI